MSWEEPVVAIATATQTLTVLVASWFAILQWRETGATRQLESTIALLNRLQGSELGATRDKFRREPTCLEELMRREKPLLALDAYLQENAGRDGLPDSLGEFRKSLRELEFIAILCLNNAIPKKLERAYLAPTMVGYWVAFSPYVAAVRSVRGDDLYLQHVSAVISMASDGSLFGRQSRKIKRAHLTLLMGRGADGAKWRSREKTAFVEPPPLLAGHSPVPDGA